MEIIALVIILFALTLIIKGGQREKIKIKSPRYSGVEGLLSPQERRLYQHINQLLASDECCYLKVSASACLKPTSNKDSDYLQLFNQLTNKYFDFVICKKASLRPVCVILIDQAEGDASQLQAALSAHSSKVSNATSSISHPIYTQDQLNMLKQACADAQLPLIFISTHCVDDPKTLKTMIDPYVNAYA